MAMLVVAIFLFSTAHAQDATTSTPEERAHWAEVTHKLEATPLDDSVNQQAEVAVRQVIDVKDFHVVLCSDTFVELTGSKYKYHSQILRLYLLGTTTYQVETGKTDGLGTNLYAFHSVLKGYVAILQQDPKAKDKKLDELVKLDADNKLPDLIAKKNCSK